MLAWGSQRTIAFAVRHTLMRGERAIAFAVKSQAESSPHPKVSSFNFFNFYNFFNSSKLNHFNFSIGIVFRFSSPPHKP